MAFLAIIGSVLLFVWTLFKDWLYLFISPIHNLQILWIIIPVWASWFFAEFFQEKKGTSFGNAISNGVVPLYIGLDWGRYLTNLYTGGQAKFGYILAIKYLLCLLILIYGLTIIIYGIKGRSFVKYYGRVRETTYVMLVFSPIIYGIVELDWKFLLSIVLFFPLFYYLIELIDKITPNPRAYEEDEEKKEQSSLEGSAGESFDRPLELTDFDKPGRRGKYSL